MLKLFVFFQHKIKMYLYFFAVAICAAFRYRWIIFTHIFLVTVKSSVSILSSRAKNNLQHA